MLISRATACPAPGMEKIYITASSLLQDSFRLAAKIHRSGFRPDFIVGIWRGGTPVGIAIQEYFEYVGVRPDHIAVRTSACVGVGHARGHRNPGVFRVRRRAPGPHRGAYLGVRRDRSAIEVHPCARAALHHRGSEGGPMEA